MSETQFPELQILSLSELAEVIEFARARSSGAGAGDPFVEWSAPWRTESLEHYLKLGWSMSRRDPVTGRLCGYILAQPFLFWRKQTQTVWIEHVDGETPAIKNELIETLIRIGREKHMQRVLIPLGLGPDEAIRARSGKVIEDDIVEFQTTKG